MENNELKVVTMVNGTRPCIATVNVRQERTTKELKKIYNTIPEEEKPDYKEFCAENKYYYKRGDVKAKWHSFGQETNTDGTARPVAVIEFDDGSVRLITVENIKFVDEESEE